ncbi:MAG: hypothetical protein B7X50_02455 [Alishewanella sp. 34-51-39]|nr:MAG: hypothetical protein B7X50_02455 [Alishewanella sp. 34-51-39]
MKEKESSENPVKYVEEIVNVFPLESRTSSKKGAIAISYCFSCIKESIKNLGFGYFKADWLYGRKCTLHSSDLEILNTSNLKQTLEQLRFILAGIENVSQQKCKQKLKFLAEQELGSAEYYVMPCALYEFSKLASKPNGSYFPDFYHLNFYEKNGRKKVLIKSEIYYHYLICNLMNRDGFLNFLDERTEVFEYKYGINQLNTLSEKLVKKKGANCSKCSTWANTDYCPIKPIALVPLEKELFFLSSYLKTPCDSAVSYSYI